MLTRLIKFLERKLSEMERHMHKRDASSDVVADVAAEAVVRRLQGRYDCGHPWPLDQLAPEFCPVHGEGCERVYTSEPLEILNPTVIRL